jgi:hypothetical protein
MASATMSKKPCFDEDFIYFICKANSHMDEKEYRKYIYKFYDEIESKTILDEKDEEIITLKKIINENNLLIDTLFEYKCYNLVIFLKNKNKFNHIGYEYLCYLKAKKNKYVKTQLDKCASQNTYYVKAWKYACVFHDDDFLLGKLLCDCITSHIDVINFIQVCISSNKIYMINYTYRSFCSRIFGYDDYPNDDDERRYDEGADDVLVSLVSFLMYSEFDTTLKINMYDEIQKYWKFDIEKFKNTIIYNFMKRRLALWLYCMNIIKKNNICYYRRIIEKID